MGVLTDLVKMKDQKDTNARLAAAEGFKAALTGAPTEETRQWATEGLINLFDTHFGMSKGKGQGVQSGQGGGGKGQGDGKSIFHHVISSLTGQLNKVNPLTTSSSIKQAVSQSQATRPQKLQLTQEEQETLKLKNQKMEAEQKAQLDLQQEAAKLKLTDESKLNLDKKLTKFKNHQELKTETQMWQQVYDRDVAHGVSPEQALKNADESVAHIKGTEGKSTEKLYMMNDKGEDVPFFRDPSSGYVYDTNHAKVNLDQLVAAGQFHYKPDASAADAGAQLKQRESAERILADPKADPIKKKAAKDTLHSLDLTDQGKQTSITVRLQNAAGGGGPAIGTQARTGISDEQMLASVKYSIQTGTKPSFGMSAKDPMRQQFNRVMTEYLASDPQAAEDRASYKAGSANLTQLTRLRGQIGSFEAAFQSDLENAREAARKIPRTSIKKFNSFEQFLQSDFTDNPDLAEFAVYAQTAINQYSRLVSSASGAGVSTDTARKEALAILDKAMPTGAFEAALNAMQKEAGNRIKGIDSEIKKQRIQMDLGGGRSQQGSAPQGQSETQGSPSSASRPKTAPKTAAEYLKGLGR